MRANVSDTSGENRSKRLSNGDGRITEENQEAMDRRWNRPAGIFRMALLILSQARSGSGLGVKPLPGSLKNEKVRVDSWTDYSADAYFEIDPAEMRRLLTLRPYEEVVIPSILRKKIGERSPSGPAGFYFFPEVPRFEPKHRWEWEQAPWLDDSPRCEISVSEDFSKAYIHYFGG
jgi:hypothetical protein